MSNPQRAPKTTAPANRSSGNGAGTPPTAPKGPAGKQPARVYTAQPTRPAPRPVSASPAKSGIRVAPARVSRPAPTRKTGFRMRPLDWTLLGLGVICVAALIWVVINSGNTPAAAVSSPNTANSAAAPVSPGQAAPDFSLPATDGQTYSLSQFRGKVVLLEFMAPWCPHCQADSPIVNQVADAYKSKNVQVLAVNATPYGRNYESGDKSPITMDDQKWFHDNFALKFPLLFDQAVKEGSVYGISSFPTIYIVDQKGVIHQQVDNPPTFEGISGALDRVLGGTGAVPAGVVAAANSTGR